MESGKWSKVFTVPIKKTNAQNLCQSFQKHRREEKKEKSNKKDYCNAFYVTGKHNEYGYLL